MVLVQLNIYITKMILGLSYLMYKKISPKWILDLNVKYKIIKLWEYLCDLSLGKEFLDMAPKVWFWKKKIDILEFTKIKNFCPAKNTIMRITGLDLQPIYWKKIFTNHKPEKGYIFRTYFKKKPFNTQQ